jgi:signal transduction histidine kinase
VRWWLALIGGVLAAVVAALLQGALAGLAREDDLRREAASDAVFDAIDQELARRVDAEESRPFLHWSYHFVPDNDANAVGISRSPLASLPELPVLGYFQIRPDGVLQTPYRPEGGSTVNPVDRVNDVEARLVGLTASLRPNGPAPAVAVEQPARKQRTQVVQMSQVGNFLANEAPEVFLAQQAALPAQQLVVGVDDPVDAGVTPFAVASVGEALLVHRQITLGGGTWTQGVAYDREALLRAAIGALPDDLRQLADVRWGSAPGAAVRPLAPPFQALTASVRLAPLPRPLSPAWLWGLSAVALGLVVAFGLLADRWIRAAEALARQRGEFVAAVSHELRTPLTSIRMYAEMLEQGMVDPSTAKSYHTTLRLEAERLGRLVDDVLVFSRLTRGGTGGGPPGTVGQGIQDALRTLEPIARAEGRELRLELPEDLTQRRVADRDALAQILVNLVDNALKFARFGPIDVGLTAHGPVVVMTVRDRGPGVPEPFRRAMFEPFVRGEPELTRTTRGTGIGLALVAGLAARLGGRASARNHPEGGLEVRVDLPAQRGEPADEVTG